MKKALLSILYFLAYYTGLIRLFYRINRGPIVITYHNIIEDELYESGHHLSLTQRASVFDNQIALLKKHLSVGMDLKPRQVHITFDDGYRNNLTVALPILKKHNVGATFFVPACYFESSELLWVDKLLLWVSHVPAGSYSLGGQTIAIETASDRDSALELLWKQLLEDYSVKDLIIRSMEDAYSFSRLEIDADYFSQRFTPLSVQEIQAIIDSGCRVACHSYCHEILSKLSGSELEEDFRKCDRHRGSYNSDWYSYPFGRLDEVDSGVVEKCIAAGYSRDRRRDHPG